MSVHNWVLELEGEQGASRRRTLSAPPGASIHWENATFSIWKGPMPVVAVLNSVAVLVVAAREVVAALAPVATPAELAAVRHNAAVNVDSLVRVFIGTFPSVLR